MKEHPLGIRNENRHYTTLEVFTPEMKQIRGFIHKSYNKGLHSQEFYEINIVTSGKANHYIGQRRITVQEGDTFIIPPNVMHGYDGGPGFDVYHILISPKYLERHSSELQLLPSFSSLFRIDPLMREKTKAKLYFRLDKNEISALLPRLNCLEEHSRAKGAVDRIIAESEALAVIATLCDLYEKHVGDARDVLMEDVDFLSSVSYLYEHYNTKITVNDLAHLAKMSRNSYIERFKRIFGQPPAAFLRSYRVDMIKQLLMQPSLSESEIASTVGCADTSHMIKLFVSHTGLTPSAFRQSLAGGNT